MLNEDQILVVEHLRNGVETSEAKWLAVIARRYRRTSLSRDEDKLALSRALMREAHIWFYLIIRERYIYHPSWVEHPGSNFYRAVLSTNLGTWILSICKMTIIPNSQHTELVHSNEKCTEYWFPSNFGKLKEPRRAKSMNAHRFENSWTFLIISCIGCTPFLLWCLCVRSHPSSQIETLWLTEIKAPWIIAPRSPLKDLLPVETLNMYLYAAVIWECTFAVALFLVIIYFGCLGIQEC